MSNNIFKYVFALVVVILIGYTLYIIVNNKTDTSDVSLDQTSTQNNIQTDLRLSIAGMDTFNPLLTNNRNVQEVTKIIYEPLVTLDEHYKMQYCLAEEIAKVDDVNYVIKLRKAVLWHDNSNFTTDDIKFTLDLLLNSRVSPIYFDNVKYITDLSIIDETTFKLTLSEPVPFFEYNLTFPIMCAKYYEGEDFATSQKVPIGTGMFKIKDISSNQIKLEPNQTYWDVSRKPMATEININLYGSIGEAYSAFKNGEIDLLTIKTNNVEEYIGTLGYHKVEFKAREYDFLAFNTQKDVLNDPVVRRAISMIIDKNNIVNSCVGAGHIASNFSLDMGCWLYTKDLNVPVDTNAASELLLNNGWTYSRNSWQKNDETGRHRIAFSITVDTSNERRVKVAENIKNQLAGFGIPVTINYYSNNTYNNAIENRNYDCILAGLNLGFSPNLNTFFGEGNIANYYNQEVKEILDITNNTSNDTIMYEKYNRLFDIYLEEVPYIGLYRNTSIVVYNQKLIGNISPNLFNVYHNIEKWYRQY